MNDVLAKFESIDRWRAAIQSTMDKHSKTLYGNGEPGHDEMIRGIYGHIKEQKEAEQRRRLWWDKLQWIFIPLVVGGITTFVWQAFTFYFKVWPAIEHLPHSP